MARKLIQGIYKITNILNGKFYIGSSNDINDRWREHICSLRQNKHHSKHLQRAWNKNGEENFIFEIIELLENATDNEIREKEKYYIESLKPYKRYIGYNVSRSTKGCILCGEDNGFYGKKHTEETRKIMRKNHADIKGENNPMHGKKHSKETKEKISQANKGNIWTYEHKQAHSKCVSGLNNGRRQKVICTTTNKVFELIKDAGEYYKLKTISHITSCCRGRRNSCGRLDDGTPLRWMYYDEYIKQQKQAI